MKTKTRVPAKHGLDYVRNCDSKKVLRTASGWQRYANRIAAQMSKRDGFAWNGVLFFADTYIRVNIGGQPCKP